MSLHTLTYRFDCPVTQKMGDQYCSWILDSVDEQRQLTCNFSIEEQTVTATWDHDISQTDIEHFVNQVLPQQHLQSLNENGPHVVQLSYDGIQLL